MKKLIAVSILALSLAGCVSDQAVVKVNVPKVVMPPEKYFNCPLTTLPKQFTTNADVASTLIQSVHDNRLCYTNAQALHDYLNKAQSTIK